MSTTEIIGKHDVLCSSLNFATPEGAARCDCNLSVMADMLEALEQLLSDSKEFHDTEFDEKSGTHTNCGWCMAKKAIARAKGGAAS